MVHGCALMYLGVAAHWLEAIRWICSCRMVSPRHRPHAAMEARFLIGLTVIEWVACDLGAAARMAARLLKLGEQHGLLASRAWGHYYLGCIHYLRNELRTTTHFGAVVDRPYGADAITVVESHFGLALTLAAQGRLTDARAIVNTVLTLAMESGNTLLNRQTAAFQHALPCSRASGRGLRLG